MLEYSKKLCHRKVLPVTSQTLFPKGKMPVTKCSTLELINIHVTTTYGNFGIPTAFQSYGL